MKKTTFFLFGGIAILILTGCAAGVNPSINVPSSEGDIAGFWMGLWHGMISLITFIISLFKSNVNIYEVHNNGGWYDFGFVIGAGILFGGAGTAFSSDD